jgi:hypothetical protein
VAAVAVNEPAQNAPVQELNLNGNNVVFDTAGNRFLVALGAGGYASCPNLASLQCAVVGAPPGLGRVDDLAAADGFVFLLNTQGPLVAVVSAAGSVTQSPIQVNGQLFSGISAANGSAVVSGGTSLLQTFTYDGQGRLSPGATADFGRGQPDVYQPSGDIAFVSTDFFATIEGRRFGITVAMLPSLQVLNMIGLLGGGIPSQATPFSQRSANFPVVSASFLAQGGNLCMLGVSPDGFTVMCDVRNPSSTRFDVAGTRDALGIAVGGTKAYVATLSDAGNLALVAYDLSSLPNSAPILVGTTQLDTGVSPPIAAAASPDGSRVVVATPNGLMVSAW